MAERSPEEKPEVKVTDRRQFTPEGERISRDEQTTGKMEPEGPGTSDAGEQESSGRADFGTLVMGLANTALIHLGELHDPSQPPSEPNLPAAREVIDLLGLLREKTRGNLTPEEQHLLETLLFKLRMDYTEKASAR